MLRRIITTAGLLLALLSSAAAQSGCSSIAQGAVLTAAQWNACFAAKQNTIPYTTVNKAGDTMLGRLTTIAPTTLVSGFNLPHGTAPVSPNNGDMWSTTAGLFVRINGSTVGPLVSSASVSLTIGTTSISSGTTTRILFDNAGVLGEYAISGTGSVCMTTSCGMVTPTLGVASGTSLALGGATIGSNALAVAGSAAFGTSPVALTHSQNAQTIIQSINQNSGVSAAAAFQAINDTVGGSSIFGTYSSANSDTTLRNRGVLQTGSALDGLAINIQGAKDAKVYVNSVLIATLSGSGIAIPVSGSSIAGLTVTGSFTATGLVANASLANPSTTVNGQICTLGSTCTITATAASVTIGTTTISSGTTTRVLYDNAGVLGEYTLVPLSVGGTNANLTASLGGIFYSTASAGAVLSGTATARQMLQSGASAAPAWSTTTWPATATINRLLYVSAANVISDLATANSGVLITDSGGIPSISSTLPSGLTIPSPTLSGTVAGSVTLSGNLTHSGTALFTGTTPSLANGNAAVAASATLGGIFTGKGSSKDVTIANGAGTTVCDVPTGGTTINCATLTLTNRLTSASIDLATNATIGVMRGDTTTISCTAGVCTAVGAAATSIAVGTTTITSGAASNILYNNAGTLGNATIASFLTAGNGIAITGTTNATITNIGVVSVVIQSFTASGTYTPTANMIYGIGECIGGGGGSGGVVGPATGIQASAGGGSGSYARKRFTAADIGASKTVTIGAGGTAGASGANNGGNGADSCITATSCVSGQIVAGKGGSASTFAQSGVQNSTPGAGGVAGTGDFFPVGNAGGNPITGSISTINGYSGTGGAGFFGGGPTTAFFGAAGIAGGANTGAGASGAIDTAASTNRAGAAGGTGYCIVTEFVKS